MRIKFFILILLCLTLTGPAGSVDVSRSATGLTGDGTVTLTHLNLNEKETIRFRDAWGNTVQEGVDRLNHLLRCRGDHRETAMALPLLDIVDHLQDRFGVDEVEVISGYRSPSFNASLRRAGRKVASRSRHMHGQAMDIRLPGVSMREVRNYLVEQKVGGVGYYHDNNFVHVDVGPFRTW